jgi:chromosome segregation ATPase
MIRFATAEKDAEIDRLRAELAESAASRGDWATRAHLAQTEAHRLRAELDRVSAVCDTETDRACDEAIRADRNGKALTEARAELALLKGGKDGWAQYTEEAATNARLRAELATSENEVDSLRDGWNAEFERAEAAYAAWLTEVNKVARVRELCGVWAAPEHRCYYAGVHVRAALEGNQM